ncbi:MAG: hypothetical protein ACXABY_02890 [Candidatus Thorarchaeota archaeon]|jgi:hypothetical protein
MPDSNNPTNANLKKDIKTFLACKQCGSTLLEEHTFRRCVQEEWTKGAIEFHNITLNKCGTCSELVLLVPPKNLINKSLIAELIGDNPIEDFIAVEKKLDMNQFLERKRRFISRAGMSSQQKGLPPIDPNKPIVKTDG